MQKYSVHESCPMCGAAAPHKKFATDKWGNGLLLLECWSCHYGGGDTKWVRAALNHPKATPNYIDMVRDATSKTRVRALIRAAEIVRGLTIKVKGVEPAQVSAAMNMIAKQIEAAIDTPAGAVTPG